MKGAMKISFNCKKFLIKAAHLASSSVSPSLPSGTSSRIAQLLAFFPPNDDFCLICVD